MIIKNKKLNKTRKIKNILEKIKLKPPPQNTTGKIKFKN